MRALLVGLALVLTSGAFAGCSERSDRFLDVFFECDPISTLVWEQRAIFDAIPNVTRSESVKPVLIDVGPGLPFHHPEYRAAWPDTTLVSVKSREADRAVEGPFHVRLLVNDTERGFDGPTIQIEGQLAPPDAVVRAQFLRFVDRTMVVPTETAERWADELMASREDRYPYRPRGLNDSEPYGPMDFYVYTVRVDGPFRLEELYNETGVVPTKEAEKARVFAGVREQDSDFGFTFSMSQRKVFFLGPEYVLKTIETTADGRVSYWYAWKYEKEARDEARDKFREVGLPEPSFANDRSRSDGNCQVLDDDH